MTNDGAAEKRLWVRLTRVCNQRCLFCHDRDAQNGTFAAEDAVRRSLALGRAQGLRRVVLSGGEPTVHPRFLKIVELSRRLGYDHVQTITNGRRFCYPAFLDATVAAGLREATFSLHGATAELHDRLTQTPGSFVQAVSGLRRALAKPGLIVSVDVVVNALNLPTLREHLEFCLALGVREFDLLALVPFSDAWRRRREISCDLSDPASRAHLHRALELSRRPGVRLWTNRMRAEHLEGFESLIQPPEKIFDELRGRRALFRRRLRGGRMSCAGEACASCFLSGFCRDLGEVRARGELAAREGPLCRPELAPAGGSFRFAGAPDADEFASFYVRSRFFAKGSACASCADGKRCAGLPVVEARRLGFSVLRSRAPKEAP
ncbi:MAG: radical SAM protein [Elusimicrobiota bacterium]